MDNSKSKDTRKGGTDSYVMFVRSPESAEVLRDPPAFTLLALIAIRARWHSGLSVHGLEVGEALIGDYRTAGLKRGQYREATRRLAKYGLATFRTTNKGTIARLTSSLVFDINSEAIRLDSSHQVNHPAAIQQPSDSHPTTIQQPLTKKEIRKEGNKETRKHSSESESEVEEIYAAYPKHEAAKPGKEAIRKALTKARAVFLLERTKAYALSRLNHPSHPRYTPLPATWFNQERFNEDPSVWSATSSPRSGQFPEDNSGLKALEV
jgi:hypothetical protein